MSLLSRIVNRLTGGNKPEPIQPQSMRRLLQLVPQVAGDIKTVIDIGASTGSWSYESLQFLPKAKHLLVEANKVHLPHLEKFVAYSGSILELKAASNYNGTLTFDDSDAFGGGIASTGSAHTVQVPCATVDSMLEAHQLPGPYLLKLDTHGFELPILEGAQRCMAEAHGVILEVYNHYLTPDSLLFYEICARMDGYGFRPGYLADPMDRPYDGTFWQMDILFLRKENPVFAHKSYQ